MSTAFPPPSRPVPEHGAEPESRADPTAQPDPPFPAITLGTAHCCPYCGAPIAVVSVLMPVEEPPAGGA